MDGGGSAVRDAQAGAVRTAQELWDDGAHARHPAPAVAFQASAPELPPAMTPVERVLARATHIAFYVLLFAMPITGWMMSSAKNYSVSWFGLFTWPDLIGQNETAFNILKTTHDTLSFI